MRKKKFLVVVVFVTALMGFLRPHRAEALSAAADALVYADALASGWGDWSWDTTRNFSNTAPVHSGSNSLAATFTAGWAGLALRTSPPLNGADYDALTFWVHGGAGDAKQINFNLTQSDTGGDTNLVAVTAPAGVWTPITITLAQLGNPANIAILVWHDVTGGAQGAFYLDDIRLVAKATAPVTATVSINNLAAGVNLDSRLLGTNLPAWANRFNFVNTTFRQRTMASGVSVVRMPGGNLSQTYGWLSCELDANQPGAQPCSDYTPGWVSRPTDFLNFIKATNKPGMWVVNPNGTSKEAAALVAFFNSAITNTTNLGIDIRGTNWYTAGHWAQLRADHGNPSPYPINLWAFGNETYAGTQCPTGGWLVMWTCDGTEYANGATASGVYHEGYAEFRAAMRAVDPSILVGAVGDSPGTDYSNWGNKVLAAAGSTMDFYDIHAYPYYLPPPTYTNALAVPQTYWPGMMQDVQSSIASQAGGRAIPVGVTEFNLFADQMQDSGAWLTKMVDSLFMADSVGQLAKNGYALANEYALVGGWNNNTDYGLLLADDPVESFKRSPQYYAFVMWSRFGNVLLPTTNSLDPATQLSVYGGRVNASTVSLMAINKTGAAITATLSVSGSVISGGLMDTAQASSLGDPVAIFNGQSNPADDLSNAPPQTLSVAGSAAQVVVPAYSVSLIRLSVSLPHRIFVPSVMKGFGAGW